MPPSQDSPPPLAAQLASSHAAALDLSDLPPPFPASGPLAAAAACANCGTRLAGPYCAQCGQHVADFHQSLWRLCGEFFDNLFCWDNKFLRTLVPLLAEPGLLTREFMAGRRVRYVQPLRLFLFVSAVCLALLQFDHGDWMQVRLDPHPRHQSHADSSPAPSAVPTPAEAASPGPGLSVPPSTPGTEDAKREPIDKDLDSAVDRALTAKIHAEGENAVRRKIVTNIQQRLSWVALALLPFFALLLRALYWRRDSFYFAHLIFSLHYHTFILLFWTAFVSWKSATSATFLLRWLSPFNWLLLLIPPAYLFLALRRVYGGGPKLTCTKVLVIGTIHLLALMIGLEALSLLTVFT